MDTGDFAVKCQSILLLIVAPVHEHLNTLLAYPCAADLYNALAIIESSCSGGELPDRFACSERLRMVNAAHKTRVSFFTAVQHFQCTSDNETESSTSFFSLSLM